jgi:two-component system phosphate regulon sensor histidine kinase PhoR
MRMNHLLERSLLAVAGLLVPRSVPARIQDPVCPVNAASAQFSGASVLDREYRVLWCNALSAAHLGIRAGSDIGQPVDLILSGSPLAAYLAAGDFSQPLRLKAVEPEGRMLSVWLVPYLDSQWLLMSLDITQSIELEAARRDCVADALHEMSSPITVLAGYLDAMRGFAFGPRRLRDCLDSMEEQCGRLRRTVESLLSLSALESTPKSLGDARIDLAALFVAIHAETEALSAGRHRVTLDVEPGFDLFGCGSEIASAFSNLASNAVRYTPAGGEIRLAWRALPAGAAEFAVEDNGIGIAKEHIPRLTERFFRVDQGPSRKIAGTGLGLAIVKDVLTRHQASLEIDSEPGRGSRFSARFSARRVIPAAARRVASVASNTGTRMSSPSHGKAPLRIAGGRTPAPVLRSAPSRVYGRVFATTGSKSRRSR